MTMLRRAILLPACLMLAATAQASITVPAGGSIALAGGALDLGCTDITVAGNLHDGSAAISNVRNVTILPGAAPDGTLDGGSGSITLAGNWTNSGTFIPGTSSVLFVDNIGCATASTIGGSTTFNNLSLFSGVGKAYTLPPGTTQTIIHALTIQGAPGNPLQITSGVPDSTGYINLASGGTQSIVHVGVSDNWAIGQPLAPLLANEGGAGNSRGWFGVPVTVPVPALGATGIGLLALLIAVSGLFLAPRRRRIHDRG